jgi:tRNA(fMet)-specific endonuclease VapC
MRDQTRTFVRGISPRDALIREAEGTDLPGRVCTDLDSLAGSWVDVPGFDEASRPGPGRRGGLAVRIASDTNRYVDVAKGLPEAVELLPARRRDLREVCGSRRAARRLRGRRSGQGNEANLVRCLDSRRVDLVFADEVTAHHYGRLFHQLRHQGIPIPTNDLGLRTRRRAAPGLPLRARPGPRPSSTDPASPAFSAVDLTPP